MEKVKLTQEELKVFRKSLVENAKKLGREADAEKFESVGDDIIENVYNAQLKAKLEYYHITKAELIVSFTEAFESLQGIDGLDRKSRRTLRGVGDYVCAVFLNILLSKKEVEGLITDVKAVITTEENVVQEYKTE